MLRAADFFCFALSFASSSSSFRTPGAKKAARRVLPPAGRRRRKKGEKEALRTETARLVPLKVDEFDIVLVPCGGAGQ